MPKLNWPEPAWRGVMDSADRVFGQYLAGVRNQAWADSVEREESRLVSIKAQLLSAGEQMRSLSAQHNDLMSLLAQGRSTLDTPTATEFQQQLERLMRRPEVLGLRMEDDNIILHVRTSTVYDGRTYDMGDFEITIGPCSYRFSQSEVFDVCSTQAGVKFTPACTSGCCGAAYQLHPHFFTDYYNTLPVSGQFSFRKNEAGIRDLLFKGETADALSLAIDTMCEVEDQSEIPWLFQEGLPETQPESSAAGEAVLDEALGQRLAELFPVLREQQFSAIESRAAQLRQQMETAAGAIRQLSENQSETQVRLRRFRQAADTLSSQDTARQLEFIQQLPGFLGLRMTDRVLVFHVRTSTVYDGRVYDMGDFQIEIQYVNSRTGTQPSLKVSCTRKATQEHPEAPGYFYHHLYFSTSNRDGTGEGSFCFGNRTQQIYDFLYQGEVAQALHLIIATMNGVNADHQYAIPRHYTEVPEVADQEEGVTSHMKRWLALRL